MIKKFNRSSSSHQDVFAYQICGENKTYLEIGGADAKRINNTYCLEKYHNWQGVSIEINKNKHEGSWQERTNPIYWGDALTVDYADLLNKHKLPLLVDYLQVDVEPARNTFTALQNVLKQGIKFNCCTFEHDHYRKKKKDADYKILADELMSQYGYKIAVDNVCSRKNSKYYETWYVANDIEFEYKDWNNWKEEIKTWAGFI